jgi:hypothetical protein
MGYRMHGRGIEVRFPARVIFVLLHSVHSGSRFRPTSYPTSTGALSPWVKSLYVAEVKNTWIYTSTPPYVFMA